MRLLDICGPGDRPTELHLQLIPTDELQDLLREACFLSADVDVEDGAALDEALRALTREARRRGLRAPGRA